MSEEKKPIKSVEKKSPIDFGKIFKDLLKHKMLYVKVLPVAFALAAIYALSLPNYYNCTVKLSPEMSGSNSNSGGLAAIASSFGEHEFFSTTFIRFYASIHADSRAYEKSGKPLFQLSFIIAGFQYNCQIAKRFSKIVFFTFSSYTGICFLKNASYF